MNAFDELCQKQETWVIKYCSVSFESPLYLVWYTDTDENSTDRLLTYTNGKIYAANSLSGLRESILKSLEDLIYSENLVAWLAGFNNSETEEYYTYDTNAIQAGVQQSNLDVPTLEGLANFINLFGDVVQQDSRNEYLEIYWEDELLKFAWEYFYDFIFWPRFNDKDRFENFVRPELELDSNELLYRIKVVREVLDSQIKTV